MKTFNKDAAEKARVQLNSGLNNRTHIVEEEDQKKLKEMAAEVGQMNTTAIREGEIVEFYPQEVYNTEKDAYIITETDSATPGDSRRFYNLYALVHSYRLIGTGSSAKKVGEQDRYVNVGNMVRRHYEVPADVKNPYEGKHPEITTRVLDDGKFNKDLAEYQLPWEMLIQFLAGKKVTAKRGAAKQCYAKFLNRARVPDEFVEQFPLVYEIAR